MAKPAKKRTEDPAETEEQSVGKKARKAKMMLMASVLMSIFSLGGGFMLARMAYLEDASTYEPEYVDESASEEKEMASKDKKSSGIVDPLAKGDHPASEALALSKVEKEKGEESKDILNNGLLDFGELLTNINGFDSQGAPTSAFLKVAVVLVYRTDPGAKELIEEREPFMRDLFNAYLRGLTPSDVKGMVGVLHMKSELLKRSRAAAGNDLPQEILINDLIVQ